MKRSEMVKYIETRLQDFDIDGKDSKKTYKEFSDIFLQELENLGMIPPERPLRTYIHGTYHDCSVKVNIWEPENESKTD